ncbi:MAG: trypsin-like peptidase domain-containing protein [Polyangiaceae bacterium]
MGLKLKGKQIERFRDALCGAFRVYEDMEMMLMMELNEDLRAITGPDGMRRVAFSVVMWAVSNRRVDDLLRGALAQNPGNEDLQLFARELALTSETPPDQTLAAAFEAKFLLGAPFQHVTQWRARMEAIERSVCRIDQRVGDGDTDYRPAGTGFLISARRILTCDHVAKHLAARGGRALFDYKDGAAGIPVPLTFAPPLARSPEDDLDYAVLALAEDAPPLPGTAAPREPLHLDSAGAPLGSPLFILQHPDGDQLRVCVGVAATGPSPKRVYYTTNTLPGSSGSPVLTLDWRLIALHHARDDALSANCGIPAERIALDLAMNKRGATA